MSTNDDRQARYDRVAQRLEAPMLVLAVVFVALVVLPLVEDLSEASERAIVWLGVVIWGLFAIEYVILLYLAPDKWEMVRTHKLDLLLVVVPFFRPLRILRIFAAGSAAMRGLAAVRNLAQRPGLAAVMGIVAGMIAVGGLLVSLAENGQAGATIDNLGDGLWWALVTCTTVGYGDEFPVTPTGRIVAVVLMLAGISALSVLTANIAAIFVANEAEDDNDDVLDQLTRIESELVALRAHLGVSDDRSESPS